MRTNRRNVPHFVLLKRTYYRYRTRQWYQVVDSGVFTHIHVGHVRSESQSVQYVPLDIWTNCTTYKHIKIKVHSFKYGTSVREK